jgi:hypothetical protein
MHDGTPVWVFVLLAYLVWMRWMAGFLVGGALGFAFAVPMQADRAHRRVLLPGSILPLLRVIILFGAAPSPA